MFYADAERPRPLEKNVETRCWKCGIGKFHLMPMTDYMWQCDNCGYVGHLKVVRTPNLKYEK